MMKSKSYLTGDDESKSFVAMIQKFKKISRKKGWIRVLEDEIAQGIDREDLETLWKLVKTKHGDTRPEEETERSLWGDLKVIV
ncbi:hypothetical protein Tco_0908254 [Tanacetum coccineum]|uniref:Uncharacterized protein n=1 Tax=Tanacetum coccineum TaxID=301880 RepID=A0ABQ5CMP4_9ASTR